MSKKEIEEIDELANDKEISESEYAEDVASDEDDELVDKLIEKAKKKEEKQKAKEEKLKAKQKNKERDKKRKESNKEVKENINIVKELLSLIIYIGVIVLLCYFIINFVGCRSRVNGNSMNPTLSDNDQLWVDKVSYELGDPKRFDVIIFDYDEDTTYVKRIIGLPGETVRIDKYGNIYIDEEILNENYGNEKISATNLGRASKPILLGPNEYFVLGDNRNNSSDSRWADVGNVNRDDIVGKVVLRFFPLSSFGLVK